MGGIVKIVKVVTFITNRFVIIVGVCVQVSCNLPPPVNGICNVKSAPADTSSKNDKKILNLVLTKQQGRLLLK